MKRTATHAHGFFRHNVIREPFPALAAAAGNRKVECADDQHAEPMPNSNPVTRALRQLLGCATLLCVVAAPMAWADDCSARAKPGDDLQAAIDQAGAQGDASLCLQAGDYPLKSFLAITTDGFTLRGQGSATVLRLDRGVQSPVIVVGDVRQKEPAQPIRRVTVASLRIVGGGHGGSEFHAKYPYLTNSAVVVRRGEQIVIRDLEVSDCRSACILTEYGSSEVTICGNDVSRAAWDGISINRGTQTVIRGNVLRDNIAAGITTEYLKDGVIEGNWFLRNGSHGIYLADAYHNTFRHNTYERNRGAGVFLTCSIRHRNPVQCWDNSMSQANLFDSNVFEQNTYGYLAGVDRASSCLAEGFVINTSRNEVFRNSPNREPDWETYGHCIRYEGSRSLP